MQVALHNNVKSYNLTAGKSLPEWLAAKKKSKKTGGLSAADEKRVELIHDFEFPDFARCVFRTANGSYLFAAGDYPPRLKCFDVNEMSLKFSFNADMPILGGVSLSPDFRKFALRGEGRMITVHNSGNIIDRLRVPHTQRCMEYNPYAAELLSGGTGHEIFRINLDQGRFMESFKTASDDGVNAVELFRGHGLVLAGCENGTVEAFDPRQEKPAGTLTVEGVGGVEAGSSIRALCTDRSGLLFAAGSSTGQVALYDVRMNAPLLVKDHMTSLPIVKVAMYSGRQGEHTHVLSADTQALRIWDKTSGKNFTTIDAPATIHDFVVMRAQHNLAEPYECADSGVIALACDTPKLQVHFVPSLGAAPRWAGFLDALTEEMEESAATVVYDDYKFITKAEADTLGLSASEVSDGRVRPAMHGVYVENRLYRELQAVANPRAYNDMVDANRKAKRKELNADRITKFHRAEGGAGAAADGAAMASGASVMTGATRGLAKADPTSAMMRSLTPQAVELLQRDPRFAAKLGMDGFAVDKDHPEFTKLFAKVKDQQDKAAERRAKHDRAQFRVVHDLGDGADVGTSGAADAPGDADEARAFVRQTAAAAKAAAREARQERLKSEKHGGGKSDGDGIQMMEASQSVSNLGATERQRHEARRVQRHKKLTLAERLAKTGK
uniref:NUC153 domain-containing protein n=1 Tax=Neobodo designis TaxID=312471 RepID=A0A7S1MBJ9_NEODS|mmetsp:Transcript_37627/g.116234  ORF Transcript_37627/g.116234 Transcript_37627/m.116234 type:complete len:668 (+) Transcript_37627:92-2095(+)